MGEPTYIPDLAEAVHGEQTHLRLPTRPDLIEPAVEYLKRKALLCGACHDTRSSKLVVALHEALTNAIVHGNLEISSSLKEESDDAFARALSQRSADPVYAGRTVEVFVDYDGQRCQWAITDQGPGFDVQKVIARSSSDDPEVLLSSGRGILLMRSFMDDLQYEAGGRRAILTLCKGSGQEKRRHERQSLRGGLRVAPVRPDGSVDWDAAYEAVGRDLSDAGVGLIQSRLAVADRVYIGIHSGDQTEYFHAEVRHCRTLDDDVVELGCRFRNETTASPAPDSQTVDKVGEAVSRLLDRTQPLPKRQERRQQPRIAYTERIEILTGLGQPARAGYARDLSKGGMAFIATETPPRTFTIVFPAQGGDPPLRVRAEVVRCSRVQEGFYDVACRFLDLAEAQVDDRDNH